MTLAVSPEALHEALQLAALRLRAQRLAETADAPAQDRAQRQALECDWRTWLSSLFPEYVAAGFASHHEEFWEWVWQIEPNVAPPPFVAIWPRGGGKSTATELATVALATRGVRRYGLYVCRTQEQADDHVQNVAALLEHSSIERVYPAFSERMVGKYGHSRGWRRDRLRTAGGFTLDAIGLDTAARGVKMEDQRPDLLIFDDLDSEHDSSATVDKLIATLTRKLLPTQAGHAAILAVQNLVHPDSLFARLADGRADFLADRIVSGPHPAVLDAEYEERDGRWYIAGGTPTWAGQDLDVCQSMIATYGLTAFRVEAQHEVEPPAGGMFSHLEYRRIDWDDLPALERTVVWVDPAVSNTDDSDCYGIQADGLAADGTIYRLWSWEQRTNPDDAIRRAILKALEVGAEAVGVETDQGGDTWEVIYRAVWDRLISDGTVPPTQHRPAFRAAKAGSTASSKTHRAQQMLADYERGRIVHVRGTHQVLERALWRFPRTKPFDLVDTAYWAWHDLRHGKPRLRVW